MEPDGAFGFHPRGLADGGLQALTRAGIGQFLGRGQGAAQQFDQGGGQGLTRGVEGGGQRGVGLVDLLGGEQLGLFDDALIVARAHRLGSRGGDPCCLDAGGLDQAFCHAAAGDGDDEERGALAPGAAGAAGAVLQGFRVAREVGMDDQGEFRQVDAAGGDVGGDADAGAAIAQVLQRTGALGLGHFAGEGDGGEAALHQIAVQAGDGGAGGAEHHGQGRVLQPEGIDHGALDIMRGDDCGLVGDVTMRLALGADLDALGVALVAFGQLRDGLGDGGGEEQGAALGRHGVEDGFQLIAEAEVEHFVRLVEHHDFEALGVEVAALDMVAQAAGGADDDVHALVEGTALHHRVHAADAGGDAAAGLGVEPGQLGLHLKGEFAGGGDDQGQGRAGLGQPFGALGHEVGGHGQAIGDGLARAGLGGDQQVTLRRLLQHGGLDRGGGEVFARGEGRLQRRG